MHSKIQKQLACLDSDVFPAIGSREELYLGCPAILEQCSYRDQRANQAWVTGDEHTSDNELGFADDARMVLHDSNLDERTNRKIHDAPFLCEHVDETMAIGGPVAVSKNTIRRREERDIMNGLRTNQDYGKRKFSAMEMVRASNFLSTVIRDFGNIDHRIATNFGKMTRLAERYVNYITIMREKHQVFLVSDTQYLKDISTKIFETVKYGKITS